MIVLFVVDSAKGKQQQIQYLIILKQLNVSLIVSQKEHCIIRAVEVTF